jgi:hypothetical protein
MVENVQPGGLPRALSRQEVTEKFQQYQHNAFLTALGTRLSFLSDNGSQQRRGSPAPGEIFRLRMRAWRLKDLRHETQETI